MKCEECKFYFGDFCRRHAPVVLSDGKDEATGLRAIYPTVGHRGDWCGDFVESGEKDEILRS